MPSRVTNSSTTARNAVDDSSAGGDAHGVTILHKTKLVIPRFCWSPETPPLGDLHDVDIGDAAFAARHDPWDVAEEAIDGRRLILKRAASLLPFPSGISQRTERDYR